MKKDTLLPTPKRNLKNFKVLVGAPQNEIKNYAWDKYKARITNLTYKNYDLFFVDNSKTKDNAQSIIKQGIPCAWLNPKNKPNQKYIAESLELIRLKAVKENYDWLCIVETDIIPPHDFIERLMLRQKLVVSGAYFIGHGKDSHLMIQQIETVGSVRNPGIIRNGRDIKYSDGKLHRVYAAGIGCCLIHRDIFTKVAFRWADGAAAHPDSFFAADLHELGIPQYLDSDFICEHHNQSWANVTDHVLS